ncbi:aminotransferase class I/II-fold pyridoxal phosphate-dependent enzyme [Anaerocolumna sedimenticola]|uniref:Aminotransferase class I/II-fold pyridoxal phosphate-dependent enzyme n=1 Tax=Anaerocolumna sedimenticola TaxID=2696063 RepID=A0A6P1TRU9_9FIRM|nr:PLP-dependent aminotransferase family protein [Anaerocolumna sedimenticola]QHQ62476.1 aminotransferase class I/II-fold pyridoxal phosphate-dependent enzyme [Anaerocolumna sedimenticola]
MNTAYSDRILKTPKSFIREILKVTEVKDIISFAGGLPNPISFPQDTLQESMNRIVNEEGAKPFQYSTTEGLRPLREYIAERYEKQQNLKVSADDILITTGSQQGLDLMGKVLVNKGDAILIEKPGYLGAIQSFSLYEPEFIQINLNENGLDTDQLEQELKKQQVKLIYTVPNFQNPTGLTYSKENRKKIADILSDYPAILIEDDPYGNLSFDGEIYPYITDGKLLNGVLFGSFSKIITPGMRIGWICTKNRELMSHLVTAKQASDLHTNIFSQYLINDYLRQNDIDIHISKIRSLYKEQCGAMLNAIDRYFPKNVRVTRPKGGMFLWVTLPDGKSTMELFYKALEKNVSFVPGNPFYVQGESFSTMRLNYTNSSKEMIEEGIKRLAGVML